MPVVFLPSGLRGLAERRLIGSITSVGVVIPVYQGADTLPGLLEALFAQDFEGSMDVLAIDSGSKDGSLGVLAARPVRVRRIPKASFDHGDTRNLGASQTTGEIIVFLTQDAEPASPDWLRTLVAHFEDPDVAGAYCRNQARPGARPLTLRDHTGDPGYDLEGRTQRLEPGQVLAEMEPTARRILCNFNNVASALRRTDWERLPFPPGAFGEDVRWAQGALAAGRSVVYAADAPVLHSHEWRPLDEWSRTRIDGWFNAVHMDRLCIPSALHLGHAVVQNIGRDMAWLAGSRSRGIRLGTRLEEAMRSPLKQMLRMGGLWWGGREARRERPALLPESGSLKVLYCVHGFPPDTWAGTEVVTLGLARMLRERGHEVAVCHRVPGEPGSTGRVTRGSFEGVPVFRISNPLEHRSIEESWDDPRLADSFGRVLAEFRPDVLHFEHMLHMGVGWVEQAAEAGCATAVTLHDFWTICPRVQLVRGDGERCGGAKGLGCLPCVKDKAAWQTTGLAWMERLAGPLGRWWARRDVTRGRTASDAASLMRRGGTMRRALEAADLVTAPSATVARRVEEGLGLAVGAVRVSDNGTVMDPRGGVEPRPGRGVLRASMLGSVVPYKGVHVAVAAMKALAGNVALTVYGDFDPDGDPYHAELEAAAEGLPVRFAGRFDHDGLGEVLAETDVVLVPSTWLENAPVTIHEAHRAGIPVVASDLGGMAEYVRDRRDGRTFPAGDAAALARILAELADGALAGLSEFPDLPTASEDALLWETRYRALAAARPPRAGGGVESRRGADFTRSDGQVELQGDGMVLLRPDAAAGVVYAFAGAEGPLVLEVDLVGLPGEPQVEIGGEVWWRGERVGELPVRSGGEEGGRWTVTVELEKGGGGEVVLSNQGPERAVFLRAAAVRVRRKNSS